MATAISYAQNFDHLCVVVSGSVQNYELQFVADLANAADAAVRGSLVTIDPTTNKFVLGMVNEHSKPMLLVHAAGDLDANGEITDPFRGSWTAYPLHGGYEYATSEFVADADYVAGTPLAGGATDDVGFVTAAAANYSDKAVIGIVSVPPAADPVSNGQTMVLRFWGDFTPAVVLTALAS